MTPKEVLHLFTAIIGTIFVCALLARLDGAKEIRAISLVFLFIGWVGLRYVVSKIDEWTYPIYEKDRPAFFQKRGGK